MYVFLFNKTDIPLHRISVPLDVNRNLQNENVVIERVDSLPCTGKRRVAHTGNQKVQLSEQRHGTMLRAHVPELTYGTAIHCFVRAEQEAGERASTP